jgi:hypothetical protein
MSNRNQAWAYRFRHIQPLEKFVLVTLGDEIGAVGETGLPLMAVSELQRIAAICNLVYDKFEQLVEQLLRRGLIRTAPGAAIELCTFINPDEWNQKKEKAAEGMAATNGRRGK